MGSFSKPQAGHADAIGDPHSAQKRLVAAFSARQLGQRIGASLVRQLVLLNHNRKATALEAEGVCITPRQASWSTTLVRHGADPGAALAEVLGMAAEDIRVRDRPE